MRLQKHIMLVLAMLTWLLHDIVLPNNLTSASLREVALNKLVALNSNTATANTVRGRILCIHTYMHTVDLEIFVL